MKKRHLLTKKERERIRLNRVALGRRRIKVKPHDRVIWKWPERQDLKDKTIEEFTLKFSAQLYRYGVTPDDQRHVKRLITLLEDVMADAPISREKK